MQMDQRPLNFSFNGARRRLACGVLVEQASLPRGSSLDLSILRSYGDQRNLTYSFMSARVYEGTT